MSETKLCPYRMFYREWAGFVPDKPIEEGYPAHADEFAPCLQEKCAMWRDDTREIVSGGEFAGNAGPDGGGAVIYKEKPSKYCGLAGKP